MKIVDTHAHIYSEDYKKYPLMDDPKEILIFKDHRKHFLPQKGRGTIEDLKLEVKQNDVDKVVIVQTHSAYEHDNSLTIDIVSDNSDWTVGVLNLDPFDQNSIKLMQNSRELGMKGNRVSTFWPKDGNILPEHQRLWEVARDFDYIITALLNPENCSSLSELLQMFPEVPVVLDHCANLYASDYPDSQNLKTVLELSKFKNLYAKLSYLVTGSEEVFPCSDMFDLTREIINAYSAERCIWGSDFPTSLWIPKVTYGEHLEIFQEHMNLTDYEKEMILGGNAYNLWFSRD